VGTSTPDTSVDRLLAVIILVADQGLSSRCGSKRTLSIVVEAGTRGSRPSCHALVRMPPCMGSSGRG
jgi:hypothetical protein